MGQVFAPLSRIGQRLWQLYFLGRHRPVLGPQVVLEYLFVDGVHEKYFLTDECCRLCESHTLQRFVLDLYMDAALVAPDTLRANTRSQGHIRIGYLLRSW